MSIFGICFLLYFLKLSACRGFFFNRIIAGIIGTDEDPSPRTESFVIISLHCELRFIFTIHTYKELKETNIPIV